MIEPRTDPPPENSAAPAESSNVSKEPAPAPEADQMAAYEQSLKESDWGHQPC